ncbi:threonine/serine exporter family protein [Tenacibaculum aquimarinum]|uniref:threonine/serine ThrE exporter family protein n=1 Tax=Tenacibaculum aquimarinum TaxID=2910675 RepID=UPI001F0A67E7|nr:threonine/serine exporter family protein [Tenacibaculum aquimarinum]MCH3885347.1 threonine/serine exporter family protein [Tenacibaculum aquimarinum]
MKIPEKYQFIVALGKALHVYGIPSYKIQAYLTRVAEKQGITGSFMDSPTWINYVFYEGDNSYNYVECVPPGSLNLGALSRISELTNKVIDSKIDNETIHKELNNIHAKTKKTNHLHSTLAYAASAGCFSIMIGTNLVSFAFSLLLGAFIYFLVFLTSKSSYLENIFESLSALTATIICCLLTLIFPNFNLGLTILASIIIFIPGLAITTALEEITSKSLVSGSAKLFDAIILLFKQFFGVLLGLALMTSLVDIDLTYHVSEMPKWTLFFAIPIFSIALLPIFQVRKKDMFFGAITGITAFFTTVLFSGYGVLVSTFIGTLVVVGASRLFSIISKTPKTVFLIQGIVMLVPGSKSFMGLSNSFFNPSTTTGSANLFEQVAFILMGIIGGLLFAGTFRDRNSRKNEGEQKK